MSIRNIESSKRFSELCDRLIAKSCQCHREKRITSLHYVFGGIIIVFTGFAVDDIVNGFAYVAPILWLSLEMLWFMAAIYAFKSYYALLVTTLGVFVGARFVEVVTSSGQPAELQFGFRLWGRRFVEDQFLLDRIQSVEWHYGQASSGAGRDMNDWFITMWYRDDNAERQPHCFGPAWPRVKTAPLGLAFIDLLARNGVEMKRENPKARRGILQKTRIAFSFATRSTRISNRVNFTIMSTQLGELIEKLKATYTTAGLDYGFGLYLPASEEAINQLERELGMSVPEELKQLLRVHGGQEYSGAGITGLFGSHRLIDPVEIIEHYRIYAEHCGGEPMSKFPPDPGDWGYWNPELIPFASWDAYDLCIHSSRGDIWEFCPNIGLKNWRLSIVTILRELIEGVQAGRQKLQLLDDGSGLIRGGH